MKTKNFYWIAQFGGWGIVSILIFFATLESGIPHDFNAVVFTTISFFIFGLVLSHTMRWSFIQMSWLELKLNALIPRILLISLIGALIITYLTNISRFLFLETSFELWSNEYLLDAFAYSIFFLAWNGIYFTFHFFQKSRQQELFNLQLIASQHEIELKNLRSQLNPHFLFNSLNSIRALIGIDPEQAQINITGLSNLLRKSLILGREQLIPLQEELALVEAYLSLEKVRFEERLVTEIEHDNELDQFQIPPFVLQTLVENAIKHGISQLMYGGTIKVRTAINQDEISLCVCNNGKLKNETETGIGIQNVKRRLELQFGTNAHFSIFEKEDIVTAQLIFKRIN